ncbi:MAG: hypothetical protein PSX71_14150 [bacterium]|nr:hypothetical protein [bacterium]
MKRKKHSVPFFNFRSIWICVSALIASSPAISADGDIIISRQVQPRAAARVDLVPAADPLLVNAKPGAATGSSLLTRGSAGELSDSDFASVSSGARLTRQLLVSPVAADHATGSASPGRQADAGIGTIGHGSGAVGNVGDLVTRSVQQGLLPLQVMQRQ